MADILDEIINYQYNNHKGYVLFSCEKTHGCISNWATRHVIMWFAMNAVNLAVFVDL